MMVIIYNVCNLNHYAVHLKLIHGIWQLYLKARK